MYPNSTWKPKLSLLDQTGIQQIHAAAINILEKTGLNVHHPELADKLIQGGARRGQGARLYLNPDMVEEALNSAPDEIKLYDRLGQPAMQLSAGRIYFGTGSDLINTIDPQTGEHRASTLEDVGRAARLCGALEEYDFVMSFAIPSDVVNEDAEPQQYFQMVSNTTKPVIMTSFSGLDSFERMHEMAVQIAGGREAFTERPNYILYGQFVSPLEHDHQALERLVFCADHQVPLIYIPTIMMGASGPFTLAGSLALAVAESLAGLVMHQTRRPGAPFIFGSCAGPLDMGSMLFPYGTPEWRLNDLLMAELSRHYGLPVFGTAGAADSKTVDAQAGAEYGTSLLVSALAGTNLIHDVGYLESGLCGSLESLVLGADQIRWVKRFLNGIQTTPDAFALDVIREVGPAGDFLGHDHTYQHLHTTMWKPYAADRDDYHAWVEKGSQSYAQRARQHALDLLHSHQPQAIDPTLQAHLAALANLEV
jgi:trimethylamine--corrinoid protein Co-methyltransferase